jgi:shikimate kinase
MNVILMGYRGCGKTSVGKKLAIQLWKTFVDVDTETCRRFGMDSIAEIWQTHGEMAWRDMEAQVAIELCAREDHIIGLGGGTLMIPHAREAVEKAHAKRIYLYCQPRELRRRINQDANTTTARPSLTDLGGGLEEIEAVLAVRDPVYRAVADDVFDVTHVNIDETVQYLIRKFL